MKYHREEQLARRIYREKGHTMGLEAALALCDKFLGSWLVVLAPRFRWFSAGEFSLFVEPNDRGDFKARIHVVKGQG